MLPFGQQHIGQFCDLAQILVDELLHPFVYVTNTSDSVHGQKLALSIRRYSKLSYMVH